MRKIICIIGARPQFIKHAPVELALSKFFQVVSIHTGQHYDEKMSAIFFDELKMQKPAYHLSIGSHSHGKQTGMMLEEIEKIILLEKPEGVLVYGDTNSTLAGALAASKLHIPIIHIEAGLRSFNREMPEEINRLLTDHLSSFLFLPTKNSISNLNNEGIKDNIYVVGDVMSDTVKIAQKFTSTPIYNSPYLLITIHRPYNTDDIERLKLILSALDKQKYKCVFPIHPRTRNMMSNNNIEMTNYNNIIFLEPQSYFELINLQKNAQCIITDSGGIQKEAYMLKVKCITIRKETEWVETLGNGWNTLVFENLDEISSLIDEKPGDYNPNIYGDGKASERIADILNEQI